MKKNLLSVLTIVSILAFGFTLFGCASTPSDPEKDYEILQNVDEDAVVEIMNSLGKCENYYYSSDYTFGAIFQYSEIPSAFLMNYNGQTASGRTKWSYNIPEFATTSYWVELSLFVSKGNEVNYDLRFINAFTSKAPDHFVTFGRKLFHSQEALKSFVDRMNR